MAETLTSGRFEGGEHRLPIRIYIEDLGGGDHVYNGNYLKFFERGRTELFRLLHLREPEMAPQPYVRYFVAAVEQRFLRPLKLHDEVLVTTRIGHVGRSSCGLDHRLLCGEAEAATARVSLVFVDATGRPAEQPSEWIAAFDHAAATS